MIALKWIILILDLVYLIQGLRITPEMPSDFSIQLCSPQRRQKTHGHMQFFPHPIKYCASIRSSKQRRHLINELRGTTSHEATVRLRWRQVASSRSCDVAFKGYQQEYRLTPDFGAYETCQFSLSKHVYDLSEIISRGSSAAKTILHFNSTNTKCPILELPTNYADYISCSLVAEEWYALEWDSSIRYETFHNGTYGGFWSNYSTAFLFQPTDQLNRNGTETSWLSRLFTVETKTDGCDRASALIRIDKYWPLSSTFSVNYRVLQGHSKVYQEELYSKSLDKWTQIDFPLKTIAGTHEICAQMTSPGLPAIRQKICRIVMDQLDCPYPNGSRSSIEILLTMILSFLIFL